MKTRGRYIVDILICLRRALSQMDGRTRTMSRPSSVRHCRSHSSTPRHDFFSIACIQPTSSISTTHLLSHSQDSGSPTGSTGGHYDGNNEFGPRYFKISNRSVVVAPPTNVTKCVHSVSSFGCDAASSYYVACSPAAQHSLQRVSDDRDRFRNRVTFNFDLLTSRSTHAKVLP